MSTTTRPSSLLSRRSFHTCRCTCLQQSIVQRHLEQQRRAGSYRLTSFPEPPPLTSVESRMATKLFAKPARFLTSVFDPKQIPPFKQPEIAFVGRSNVGKSTLINRLTNNSKLVKTSSKPGHTKSLNFFNIADQITLVDMPGYGFRSQEEWGELILHYLRYREQLKRLYIIIDPVAGIKETDKQIMQILDQQPLSYQVILTKRDRLTDEAFQKSKSQIERYLVEHAICCYPEILTTGKRRKSKKDQVGQMAQDIARIQWSVMTAAGVTPTPPSSS
ncbi:P-loop containing nucleoside triphosphate hydrolase protein [Zychaea mexicana]|uniref:P-loop containing nucleoside triphosphate hydrolase protein n=1 Tax=Zychaea mexicana TaxID=64656 RepID=UPI0022FF18C5|nr:P-loop containing nucleoside triphosphate hydrolase protein [Zychaea mexicana]KAI9492630.1 P-loop containing nucleoside triphosphate hydrolase protein [Zychaea mexicana]